MANQHRCRCHGRQQQRSGHASGEVEPILQGIKGVG
jgi:hypothetical protein